MTDPSADGPVYMLGPPGVEPDIAADIVGIAEGAAVPIADILTLDISDDASAGEIV